MKTTQMEELLWIYNAQPKDIKTFTWPNDVTIVTFAGDYLDELIIPEGIESVMCSYMGLRKLILPRSIKYVYANYNSLLELIVPNNIVVLEVSNNPLYNLRFSGGDPLQLTRLEVNATNIDSLVFRTGRDCHIEAFPGSNLLFLSHDTSFALRYSVQQIKNEKEIMLEPDHWIIVDDDYLFG
jgi:hypothetical protein